MIGTGKCIAASLRAGKPVTELTNLAPLVQSKAAIRGLPRQSDRSFADLCARQGPFAGPFLVLVQVRGRCVREITIRGCRTARR
jgi:hypothetical protein